MDKLHLRQSNLLSPPPTKLPIIQKLVSTYKLWDEYVQHFPKKSRYTLGSKIDTLLLESIELLFTASYVPREQKLSILQKATTQFDTLKFFLQVAWEIKALDNKKYIALSAPLDEVGRMLGGWRKQTSGGSAS